MFVEWHRDTRDGGPNARAVITPDRWKLVLHDTDHSMLFDHNNDPLEMHNLYYEVEHASTVRKLRLKIEAWQEKTRDTLALPEPTRQ